MSWVFDTLIWKDEQGSRPALAHSWTYDPEALAFVFELEPEARWHDGEALTAADVAFTIKFFQEHPYYWIGIDDVSHAEVLGPHRVAIHLRQPYAPFLADIAGTMPIMPAHIWRGIEDPNSFTAPEAFIGSGPYRFVDFNPVQGSYLYEAFADYYLGEPSANRLIYHRVGQPIAALRNSEVDLAIIRPEMVEPLQRQGFEIIQDERGWNKKLMINHRKTPFDDRLFRCLRGGIVTELRLQGVAKRYGDIHALHPTDLELRAGETFCLVGESGSGKTTLALMAAGMLGPDQGERIFRGRAMESWLRQDRQFLARHVGVVQQHPARAVSHRFTVFEIVAEPLRIQEPRLGRDALRERVIGALRDVNLAGEPEFLQRYPHELNLGALQRVCIARALITGPSLLIADEPTSALDPGVQAKVLKRLLELQIEKGLTLLMVTHDLGLARKVADRIGVMQAGRIVESGPAVRVLNHPEHAYTCALLQGPFRQELAASAAVTRGGPLMNDPYRGEPCSSTN